MIIGQYFLDVKDRVMSELDLNPKQWILAQGTIYPDIITSGGSQHARVIKTHHNALPSLIHKMEVLEPIRYLYKDEVRKLAAALGFGNEFVWKHPFPGPGIAVRIAGAMTNEKITLYHQFDKIVLDHLHKSGWYEKLWMGFPVLVDMAESAETDFSFSQELLQEINHTICNDLDDAGIVCDDVEASVLPIRSVGVKGDYRSYEHPVALRIINNNQRFYVSHQLMEEMSIKITNKTPLINRVLLTIDSNGNPQQWKKIVVLRMLQSIDTLTADWGKLEHDLLDSIGKDIMCVSEQIDAVLFDITQKPPSTMEWE